MERNINIFFSLVFTIATTFNAFAQVSKVEVTTNTLGNFETQINNMHRPSGLAITAGSSPDFIVGELASYLEVNKDFPNLGPFVSFFDRQGSMLSRLDKGFGPGVYPGQFISPHSIALDSLGDLYIGDVAETDWKAVMGKELMPDNLRRFQKILI